jgi:FkbM family methyltransferase
MVASSSLNYFSESLIRLESKIRISLANKVYDPLITFNLRNCPLTIPLSHQLPAILKLYPAYSDNLSRVAKRVHEKYAADFTLIDIGANVGDSVALLRYRSDFPILCIEGDERFFALLSANTSQFDNVALEKAFVGSQNSHLTGSFEFHRGSMRFIPSERAAATSMVTSSSRLSDSGTVQMRSLPDILQSHPTFAAAKMLKVDTDGYDNFILRGSLPLLAEIQPVLFFEYSPSLLSQQGDDGVSIFGELIEVGYSRIIVYDPWGYYVTAFSLKEFSYIEDLHFYLLSHKRSWGYVDLCVFHESDTDIFDGLRNSELDFFRNLDENISHIYA